MGLMPGSKLFGVPASLQVDMSRQIRLRINDEHCRACSRCLAAEVCKVRAIVRLDHDEPPFLDVGRCYDCRLCIPACPFKAISAISS